MLQASFSWVYNFTLLYYSFFQCKIVQTAQYLLDYYLQHWSLTKAILSSDLSLQDLACIDELSTNSLFSSPADSLSEYADSHSFINADNLDTVPTIWDINTNTTNAPAQSQSEVGSKPLHTHLLSTFLSSPLSSRVNFVFLMQKIYQTVPLFWTKY